MNRLSWIAFAQSLVLLGTSTELLVAQPADEKVDFNKPESPKLPEPKGLKFIDQGQFDPRLKGYRTPEGFKVEIVADAPTIINPVGMRFGPDGSLFVLEWTPDSNTWPETPEKITYRDGTTRTVATMRKKVKDLVKVLTYNAEKGTFDAAKVILEDELPSSILIHAGYLYTASRSTVRRWKLADIINGDNKNAKPEIIAQGFCGFHHHQVSGLTIGNDGWLYITSGDDDNYAEGSDGSRATVLRTGAVFRCRPDGSKLHMYSMGYRNPYRDMVYDEKFNWFHVDNDNEDGSKFTGCRLMHVAEESDFGWRLYQGARCCRPDPVRGAVYGELPGKMPPLLKTGRGSPAGLLIYNDQHLPGFYRGWLYYPDVFRKLIRAYKVQPHGSTFKAVNEFEFLRSDDPLFRPCQMIAGPDGAIYIADWRTDSGGAGRLFGDGQHGRIYRVTWAGGAVPDSEKEIAGFDRRAMTSLADIVKKKDEELLDLLESVSALFADAARDELAQRGDKNRPALVKLVGDSNTKSRGRLRAIGALQSMWNDEVKAAFIQALGDLEPDIRRLAAEGLALNCAKGDREAHAALSKQIGDPDLPARRAILLAIGKINADNASEVVVEAYKFDDGKDVYLTDGIIRAIERTGKRGIQQLLAAARSGKDADREKVVAAFLTLRTPDGAEAIPELLADPHLSVDQRVAVIKSYSNYLFDPPVSMVPLTEFLTARPTETLAVQLAGFEVLADTGNLKGAKLANVLTALLDAPDDETRLGAIRAIEKGRTSEAAPRLIQVLGENGRSGAERVAIIKALRLLGDKASGTALKEILAATHPAALHLEALRSLAVIDPASTFAVAEKFLDFADAALRNEAVQILGTRPEGAKIIGQRFIDKKLPTELLPQVSEALRKHADKNPELKQMLTDVMKGGLLLSTQPGEIERIRQLVKTKGNAQRGKLIYLNSKQLACVTCHKLEGVGGQVGPDLTKVWETATIEKIMESIIEPSKEIKEGFQSFKATTKNGQTFTGLKAIDKPTEVVIRDANGKDITILRDNLEELNPSKVSLMPDNVVSQLSFDQFVDLVAFLKSKETQESLRGMVTEFLVVGPFGAKLEAQYGPEIESDAKLKYRDESTPPKMLSWEARSAEPNGFLNLRTIFNKDRASAYALTHVHSQKAQKAIIYVGADDSMRVWVNGKRVHEFANSRQAMPDNDRVEVDFKEGFNTVVIKVVNRSDEHGIFLRIKGEGLKFSARKE